MRALKSDGTPSAYREGERHMDEPANSDGSVLTGCDMTRRELLEVAVVSGALVGGQLMPGFISAAAAQAGGTRPASLDLVLRVNGTEHRLTLDPRTTLLDALREHLHLTGSKKGCGLGQCGACTVLMDGRRVKSCLSRAAFQCGYCTPGQIMAGVACIDEGHAESSQDIRDWMSGNVCRCGAYDNIV